MSVFFYGGGRSISKDMPTALLVAAYASQDQGQQI